jgi:hypothetical protein
MSLNAARRVLWSGHHQDRRTAMTVNVGTLDRIVRAALGAGLLYLAFFSGLPLFQAAVPAYLAAGLGVVMLGVAVTRFCPVYALFGFRSCKV